ncbi:MAG: hypothetical protein AB7O04_13620 [Hyphomonadaceae bacterium]
MKTREVLRRRKNIATMLRVVFAHAAPPAERGPAVRAVTGRMTGSRANKDGIAAPGRSIARR